MAAELTINLIPLDEGRNRAKTIDFFTEIKMRTLHKNPRGGDKTKSKIVFKSAAASFRRQRRRAKPTNQRFPGGPKTMYSKPKCIQEARGVGHAA